MNHHDILNKDSYKAYYYLHVYAHLAKFTKSTVLMLLLVTSCLMSQQSSLQQTQSTYCTCHSDSGHHLQVKEEHFVIQCHSLPQDFKQLHMLFMKCMACMHMSAFVWQAIAWVHNR